MTYRVSAFESTYYLSTTTSPSSARACLKDSITPSIYTLSLHDALPIFDLDYQGSLSSMLLPEPYNRQPRTAQTLKDIDRKSTRLNSSHDQTSYAVFCLKKKTRRRTAGSPDRRPARSGRRAPSAPSWRGT